MTKAKCILCVQDQPIDAFRSLPCGHTYCATCIETWVRRRPLQQQALCPTCRGPFIEADLRRIYLTLPGLYGASQSTEAPPEPEDATVALKNQTNYVVERLKQIDTNTPAKSVVRAGHEVGKIAKYTDDLVRETQSTLWVAIDELKERIAPMYVEKAEREKAIAALQLTVDDLKLKSEEYRKLSETLRAQVGQHQKRHAELETENRELKGRLAEIVNVSTLKTEKFTAVEDENRSLRLELEEQKQRANKATAKATALSHQLKQEAKGKQRGQTRRDGDDTLVVLSPDLPSAMSRSPKRRKLGTFHIDPDPDDLGDSSSQLRPRTTSPTDTLPGFSSPEREDPPPQPLFPAKPKPKPKPKAPSVHTLQKTRTHPAGTHDPVPSALFQSNWTLPAALAEAQGAVPTQRKFKRSDSGKLPFPLDANGRTKATLQHGPKKRMGR